MTISEIIKKISGIQLRRDIRKIAIFEDDLKHKVIETDKAVYIDGKRLSPVIDNVTTEPFGKGAVVTLTIIAKSYRRKPTTSTEDFMAGISKAIDRICGFALSLAVKAINIITINQ